MSIIIILIIIGVIILCGVFPFIGRLFQIIAKKLSDLIMRVFPFIRRLFPELADKSSNKSSDPKKFSWEAHNYLHIRDEIHKEHALLNQRLQWLVTSQSFLFVPFAMSLNAYDYSDNSNKLWRLSFLIPRLGISICIAAFIGIIAAIIRINYWKKEQYDWIGKWGMGVLYQEQTPYGLGRWFLPFLGFLPTVSIPILIICAWCYLLPDSGGWWSKLFTWIWRHWTLGLLIK
jgi:hypothetical protein